MDLIHAPLEVGSVHCHPITPAFHPSSKCYQIIMTKWRREYLKRRDEKRRTVGRASGRGRERISVLAREKIALSSWAELYPSVRTSMSLWWTGFPTTILDIGIPSLPVIKWIEYINNEKKGKERKKKEKERKREERKWFFGITCSWYAAISVTDAPWMLLKKI